VAVGEQRLAEHGVDLVRAGVVEVFALEDDARSPGVLCEARHLGDDRGPPGVGLVQLGELRLELGVGLRRLVGRGELVECGDERFGHVSSAELAEVWADLVAQVRHVRNQGIL
jgi:hypothetical protein